MCGLLDQLLETLSDFLPVQFTAGGRCTAGEGRPRRRPQGAGHSPGSDSTRSPTVSTPIPSPALYLRGRSQASCSVAETSHPAGPRLPPACLQAVPARPARTC